MGMAEYQSSGHARYDIKYHFVWITKYRHKVLRGEVAERARELIRQRCQMREVQIVRGAVSVDHVHMLVAARPQLSPAKLVPANSTCCPKLRRAYPGSAWDHPWKNLVDHLTSFSSLSPKGTSSPGCRSL